MANWTLIKVNIEFSNVQYWYVKWVGRKRIMNFFVEMFCVLKPFNYRVPTT